MKRSITLAAVGLSAALALTACSSSKSTGGGGTTGGGSTAAGDSGKAVTISLLAPSYGSSDKDDTKLYWDGIVKDFEAANPNIKVDVQMATWDNLATKLKTAVQNNAAPDLFEGGGYADVAAQGLLYKVSDIVSPSTVSDLIPHVADLGKTKGADGADAQYGIPFTTSTRSFFYNKDMFAAAGIAAAPQTWADVAADAKLLKAKFPTKTAYGLPLGSEEAQAETYLWTLGNGGGYKDASGKWAINQQANVDTFQWLTDNLVKPGLTEADPATKNRTDLWKDFAAGNVGMINGSPALIPILKTAGLADSSWASATIPGKTGPLTSPLGVADFIEAFNTHPDHKAAVGKFLDFALAKKYQEQFDLEYMLLPATTSASTDLSASTPALKPFIDAIPTASWYPSSDPKWDPTSQKVKDIVGKAVTGDPKAVLDQIQAVATAAS